MDENESGINIKNLLTKHPKITFLRNVFNSHTDVFASNTIYEFVNNVAVIESTNFIGVIERMWLNTSSNIKNLLIFLVGPTININTLNFNTVSNDDIDLQLIHKVSINGLKTSNKIMLFSEYSEKTEFIAVPHNKSCFVPYLFKNGNKKLVFVIEPEHKDSKSMKIKKELIVKYAVSNDSAEILRFKISNIEWLMKRLHTVYHNIEIGENKINADIVGMPLSHIIINTEKNKNDKLKIKFDAVIKNNVDKDKCINIEHDLLVSDNHPEYNRYVLDSCDIYLIDPYCNLTIKGMQPMGSYLLEKSSKFTIVSKINTKIEITYCIFDILRDDKTNKMFYLFSQNIKNIVPNIYNQYIESTFYETTNEDNNDDDEFTPNNFIVSNIYDVNNNNSLNINHNFDDQNDNQNDDKSDDKYYHKIDNKNGDLSDDLVMENYIIEELKIDSIEI